MAEKIASRQLVIDTDVAGASGGKEAVHPTATRCRDFLEAVLEYGHRLVMTPEIAEEWAKHQSAPARAWRLRMYARRRVVAVDARIDTPLREKLKTIDYSEKQYEAVEKDLHLIEAARAVDETVASCDKKVRRLFSDASASVAELRTIVWVNPDEPTEEPIAWLKVGATPEQERMLGGSHE